MKTLRKNYYYLIIVMEGLIIGTVLGLANNLSSLYLVPITQELRISRSLFSTVSTIRCLFSIFSSLLFGVVYRYFGMKKLIMSGLLLNVFCYFIYARATSIFPFFLGGVIYGLCSAIIGTCGTARLISNWFHSRQGMILGIIMASSELGGAVFCIVLSEIMIGYGWRASFQFSCILLSVVSCLSLFIIKSHPSEVGLKPYDKEAQKTKKQGRSVYARSWSGLRMEILLKKPYFYLTFATLFLSTLVTYGTSSQTVAHLQDQGFSQRFSAQTNSILLLSLAVSKIIIGILSDRFGAHLSVYVCMGCNSLGVFLLAIARHPWQAVLAVLLLGIGLCTQGSMQPLLASELFGKASYTTVLGAMMAIMFTSGLVTPPLINAYYDSHGSYSFAFLFLSIMSLLTIGLFVIVFRIDLKRRKKVERNEEH